MPSHQERIRLKATSTTVIERTDMSTDEIRFEVRITKLDIASWPYPKDLAKHVTSLFYKRALENVKQQLDR